MRPVTSDDGVVDRGEKAAFVQMQFAAQAQYYREHYPDTSFDAILLGDEAVGRLYVSRWRDELRIVDIALLPEFCNRGIGTTLLHGLQSEAAAAGKPLRIHVERFNPALRLHERLGFKQIEDKGVYLFLEWGASQQGGRANGVRRQDPFFDDRPGSPRTRTSMSSASMEVFESGRMRNDSATLG